MPLWQQYSGDAIAESAGSALRAECTDAAVTGIRRSGNAGRDYASGCSTPYRNAAHGVQNAVKRRAREDTAAEGGEMGSSMGKAFYAIGEMLPEGTLA